MECYYVILSEAKDLRRELEESLRFFVVPIHRNSSE